MDPSRCFSHKSSSLTLQMINWRLPEKSDVSMEHAGGFMFMDNLYFYRINVHMLVYINDYGRLMCFLTKSSSSCYDRK